MYITCTSHVYHMYITCTSHVYHMCITCTSHAHWWVHVPFEYKSYEEVTRCITALRRMTKELKTVFWLFIRLMSRKCSFIAKSTTTLLSFQQVTVVLMSSVVAIILSFFDNIACGYDDRVSQCEDCTREWPKIAIAIVRSFNDLGMWHTMVTTTTYWVRAQYQF